MTIIKLCAEAILIALIAGIIILVIGYFKAWDALLPYSNAFFLAGCVIIIAGGLSRLAASQEAGYFRSLNAESFRDMSSNEQAEYIINVSSPYRLVILGFLSGLLLILVSAVLVGMM